MASPRHSSRTGKKPRYSGKSDVYLLLAAAIWGFAFVAQRMGMDHVGPFTFNGIRFALGALVALPLIFWIEKKQPTNSSTGKKYLWGGLLAGIFLFMGASFQQVGIVSTTAGNAGFITGLYVVLVPIFGLFLGQRTSPGTAVGAILAFTGLYLLSVTDNISMSSGDFLVLIGAFFWAGHVLIIGHLSRGINSGKLAFIQYSICAAFSLAIAIAFETITSPGIQAAAIPLLYGGLVSVGIAYTLQIVGQKRARPSHAAIILSLEAAFAAFGGWLILGEAIPPRGLIGAGLMLAGMFISGIWMQRRKHSMKRY
jgi:drug/metabolite transporter (DMT)-like permease